MRTEILSTIDELNQYLLGNVTEKSLLETLESLKMQIKANQK